MEQHTEEQVLDDIEWFTGGRNINQPSFSIFKRATASRLNNRALHELGNPKAVQFGFDTMHRVIVIRPAQEGQPGAYPLRQDNYLSCRRFVSAHGIVPEASLTLQGHVVDGMLVFPLPQSEN